MCDRRALTSSSPGRNDDEAGDIENLDHRKPYLVRLYPRHSYDHAPASAVIDSSMAH